MRKSDSPILWSVAENIIRGLNSNCCIAGSVFILLGKLLAPKITSGLITLHDILKYTMADLFPLTHRSRDGFDHDFHRRGRQRQSFLHLLHQRGARSGAGGAGGQARQQNPRLPQTAVFQSLQDQEPGGGGQRLPWPGSHWNLLLRIRSGLFASRNGHDDQQLWKKWVRTLCGQIFIWNSFPAS